ncbi:MAG: heme-binding protein [Blastocatellia bacterium]
MLKGKPYKDLLAQARTYAPANPGDDAALGPLKLLPGTWKNLPNLPGRGWNMIALPFATEPKTPFNYRLLVNQYNEELKFTLVDKAVPNRGIKTQPSPSAQTDQFIVTLDYQQSITQIAAADNPVSGKAGVSGQAIHHEPGLWLHMLNEVTDGLDIARLGTIPHGDSILALGKSQNPTKGAPTIPDLNGLPEGVPQNLNSRYLAPYKHFHDNLFQNLFDPTIPNELLKAANTGVNIVQTTTLTVDSTTPTGGIVNIPFIVKQANATSMKSTFWIQELAEKTASGKPKLRLQYSQVVMLDFFPRVDGLPGLIRWPHVSINTLEKVD